LIVGSRRLRDVVLAATSFALAHSVTFLLAALGVVSAPAAVVEPVIALSIAVVALGHVWSARRGPALTAGTAEAGRRAPDRARWLRLAGVVGLRPGPRPGVAGAPGARPPVSWSP